VRPPNPLDDPKIISLAREIQEDLAAQPEVTTMALVDAARGAWQALGSYPQLDEIEQCYRAGPEDFCAFCTSGGLPHTSEPQEVPAWVHDLRGEPPPRPLSLRLR